MKKIQLAVMLLATLMLAACVEDKVYEGPSNIDAVIINPEAPTSFDNVTVTATVSGLMEVTKAVLTYTIDGNAKTVDMTGSGKTWVGIIPAQADGTKVKYSVTVTNEAGYSTTSGEKDYTVGDKPSDFTKLVLNELYGAAKNDEDKYIELYNNGDDPIKLKDVIIKKDEEIAWTGLDGEVVMGHSFFTIVGAKSTTERGISTGLSSKKSVLIELYDPNNNLVDKFQRGEKGEGWGKQSLYNNEQTWSRCPNGTGKFMIAPGTLGAKNPDEGEPDDTVVQ